MASSVSCSFGLCPQSSYKMDSDMCGFGCVVEYFLGLGAISSVAFLAWILPNVCEVKRRSPPGIVQLQLAIDEQLLYLSYLIVAMAYGLLVAGYAVSRVCWLRHSLVPLLIVLVAVQLIRYMAYHHRGSIKCFLHGDRSQFPYTGEPVGEGKGVYRGYYK